MLENSLLKFQGDKERAAWIMREEGSVNYGLNKESTLNVEVVWISMEKLMSCRWWASALNCFEGDIEIRMAL